MKKEDFAQWNKGRDAFLSGDLLQSREIFETMAENGVLEAFPEVANLYEYDHGELDKDYEKSFYWYQKAAFDGDLHDGHEGLARAYYYGLGVEQDYKKAEEHLLKALPGGTATAHILLGKMFLFGRGGKTDLTIAREHFQIAADNGNVFAMRNIARMDMQQGYRIRGLWKMAKVYFKATYLGWKNMDDPRLRDG